MKILPLLFSDLSNHDLLAEVQRFAAREREATAHLIAALMEIEVRRLYLGEGCSSLFTYCTQVLNLSEHAAYGRIEAARAARRFPVILERLLDGSLTLTSVCLLAPHLTAANHIAVLIGTGAGVASRPRPLAGSWEDPVPLLIVHDSSPDPAAFDVAVSHVRQRRL